MGRSQWRIKVKNPREGKGMIEQVGRLGAEGRTQRGHTFKSHRRQEAAMDSNTS